MKRRKQCLVCNRPMSGPGSYHARCKASLDAQRGGKGRRGYTHIPKGYESQHEARLAAVTARIRAEMAAMGRGKAP